MFISWCFSCRLISMGYGFFPNGRKWDSATGNASKYQIVCKREAWPFKYIHYYSLAAMLGCKKKKKTPERFLVRFLAWKNWRCPIRFSLKNFHFMFARGIFWYLLLRTTAKICGWVPHACQVTTLFSIFAILKKKEAEWPNYWLWVTNTVWNYSPSWHFYVCYWDPCKE